MDLTDAARARIAQDPRLQRCISICTTATEKKAALAKNEPTKQSPRPKQSPQQEVASRYTRCYTWCNAPPPHPLPLPNPQCAIPTTNSLLVRLAAVFGSCDSLALLANPTAYALHWCYTGVTLGVTLAGARHKWRRQRLQVCGDPIAASPCTLAYGGGWLVGGVPVGWWVPHQLKAPLLKAPVRPARRP